ncbi:hypothetical protein PI124_g1685 [Phytophthora idaei]|nr:hypothetical protein PI125_g6632 [Phytophthora idaei]KAG3157079.1 hypothetical protein PI126_g8477 [Phytophthora idaei]KAG3253729.1 hypothetical protein PI124_g1685 [Phytophthora idaei]
MHEESDDTPCKRRFFSHVEDRSACQKNSKTRERANRVQLQSLLSHWPSTILSFMVSTHHSSRQLSWTDVNAILLRYKVRMSIINRSRLLSGIGMGTRALCPKVPVFDGSSKLSQIYRNLKVHCHEVPILISSR